MKEALSQAVESVWYGRHPAGVLLAPFGQLWRAAARARRAAYASGLLNVYRAPVPVVVVGNLSVGGTGKTPLVVWLASRLRDIGFRPGIIARGYRGAARTWPQQVRADSDPVAVGDEAVLLARRTGLPVAVGPNRRDDIVALLRHRGVNIVVSDDGLQHYAMARDIEIAVVDGVRRFGNGACLPAGPLREPVSRLASVDLVVTSGIAARGEFPMKAVARGARRLRESTLVPLADLHPREVHAVAGIGRPDAFFALLKHHGFTVTPHAFPDHHRFSRADLEFGDDRPVLMTEKDAVKCEHFDDGRLWCVPIDAELPDVFERRLTTLLKRIFDGQEAA